MNSLQHQSVFVEKQPTPAASKESGSPLYHGKLIAVSEKIKLLQKKLIQFFSVVQSMGITVSMTDYERRKLQIFNLLNFLNLIIDPTIQGLL